MKQDAVTKMAIELGPFVAARLKGRDMYTMRKTHVSWARQLVNHDCVMAQVGHAPSDTEERAYLDLVDASVSSQAVYDVLVGKLELPSVTREKAMAIKLEKMTEKDSKRPESGQDSAKISKTSKPTTRFAKRTKTQTIAATNVKNGVTERRSFEPFVSLFAVPIPSYLLAAQRLAS